MSAWIGIGAKRIENIVIVAEPGVMAHVTTATPFQPWLIAYPNVGTACSYTAVGIPPVASYGGVLQTYLASPRRRDAKRVVVSHA